VFTYQGQLKKGADAISGNCDMAFRLYDQVMGGNQVGDAITTTVPVSNSLFTVQLDFGNVFNGDARWLEVAGKCGADASHATLAPRQPLTAAPYALYAPTAGSVPWTGLTGTPPYTAGFGLALSGMQFSVLTGTIQQRVSGVCGSGYAIRQVNGDGSVVCEPMSGGGQFWSLTGNAGTVAGVNFLGTTDNVSLTLAVSDTAALRIEPNATCSNLIGGYSGNSVWPGVVGAVIGGGGDSGDSNSVIASYGTVDGGSWSSVSDRNLKENFTPVDGQEVLARLMQVPISTWNYKSQDPSVRHLGPMAQDFSLFGVGEDDTHISTVDADGVALAAIQGLYRIVQEQDARISQLEAQNADIEAHLAALEARMKGNTASSSSGWSVLSLMLVGLAVGLVVTRRGGGR
jgi:hypothetical protein